MELNSLSNEEILFNFFMFKGHIDKYERLFGDRGYYCDVPVNFVNVEAFVEIPDSEINMIKSSPGYIYLSKIYKKLERIAGLIKDSDKELYDQIEEIFGVEDEEQG
jgi:hypothetical protein